MRLVAIRRRHANYVRRKSEMKTNKKQQQKNEVFMVRHCDGKDTSTLK